MSQRLDNALSELGHDGNVRPGDEDLILRAADAALARTNAPVVAPRSSGRAPWRLLQVAAAAFLMLSAGASAAWWVATVARQERSADVAVVPARTPAKRVTKPAPVALDEPAPLAEPLIEAAVQRDEAPTTMRDTKRAQPQDAATLFHAASVARGAGDTTRAQKLYGQLIAQHPDSDEAHVAHVALGKLWLAAGRASAAEREFRQYLDAGGGPPSEEALFSRAQALQRLERTVEERAAWTKLLHSYPHSVYAGAARARLAQP